MLNFSLKKLYVSKIGNYLLLIALLKWGGMICAILGVLLAVLFNNYWIAIIVGVLLAVIGVVVSLIAHVISKKLNKIITKGGSLIAGTENYLKKQAIQQSKKLIPKRKNNSNKSL